MNCSCRQSPRHGLKGGVPVHLAPKKETQDPCTDSLSQFPNILRVNVACEKKTWACDFFKAPDSLKSQGPEYAVHKKAQVMFRHWIM